MGAYAGEVSVDEASGARMQVVNSEQAAAWDGHEGDVWTDQADRYDRANRRIVQRFFASGVIRRGDEVLDVGCGTGAPTRLAAGMAVDGDVVGIDLSARMLELARHRSAEQDLVNVAFVQGDAQVFPFNAGACDVAISSFGTMFFNDPVAAFANIAHAVRGGGSLAMLAWRSLAENRWLMEMRGALAVGRDLPMPPPNAPTPFALADPARVQDVLGRAGFDAIELTPIDEPLDFGDDAVDALDFASTMGLVEGLVEGLDAPARSQAMANLAEVFERHATPGGVLLDSSAWLIVARKP